MKLQLDESHYILTEEGYDLSLPLSNDANNPLAWYVSPPTFEPVRADGYVGAVAEGGSVNFRTITFNPHGHGTHTECLGHITKEIFSINQHLKEFFFTAEVITLTPEKEWNEEHQCWDEIISLTQLKNRLTVEKTEAVILRTMPNEREKKHKNYSNSNPPYLSVETIEHFNELGVQHLLIDLPSVDREMDGGKLAFHHAFWQVPNSPQYHKTITEFIYVDENVPDGSYLLNLQVAAFENDAAPSRPVIYKTHQS